MENDGTDFKKIIEQARDVDRILNERKKERYQQEYGGLKFFQRLWKRLTREKTTEELIDKFGCGL